MNEHSKKLLKQTKHFLLATLVITLVVVIADYSFDLSEKVFPEKTLKSQEYLNCLDHEASKVPEGAWSKEESALIHQFCEEKTGVII